MSAQAWLRWGLLFVFGTFLLLPFRTAAAGQTQVRVYPSDDVTVSTRPLYPGEDPMAYRQTLGAQGRILPNGDRMDEHHAYLKFDLSRLPPKNVQSVVLYLMPTRVSAESFTVYRTGTLWEEETLVWLTAPVFEQYLGTSGAFQGGVWISVDLTGAIGKANRLPSVLSIAVDYPWEEVLFYSKDTFSTATWDVRPYLLITFRGQVSATYTPLPPPTNTQVPTATPTSFSTLDPPTSTLEPTSWPTPTDEPTATVTPSSS